MFYDHQNLQNSRILPHWQELWANRNSFNQVQAAFARDQNQVLAGNAASFSKDFWKEVDASIIENRKIGFGMEIVLDLQSVQTVLDVGKTVKMYNKVGEIAKDVKISLDGQAPYSFDHTDYDSDGDPIPVFTAGYGVNWRHARGLSSIGVDLVLDSQAAKMEQYERKIVSYMLSGSSDIIVDGKPAQGLKNHRNTKKINLGAGGANINLTTATPAQVVAFFTTGDFGQNARANGVAKYDVLWVSYEIWANFQKPYDADNVLKGSVITAIMPYMQVGDVRPTYALTGNEFLGYERRRDVVSPLVGAPVGITPLPRPLPNTNYNFQILSALGIQVKTDGRGKGGVVYGAEL